VSTWSTRVVVAAGASALAADDVARCHRSIRIPMAAEQPSINLAQAVQLVAYELFLAGLEARNAEPKAE